MKKLALIAITIMLTMTMTITKPSDYGDELVMITITRMVAGAADDNTAAGAADGAGAAPDES